MKTQILSPRSSIEDAEFLQKIQRGNLGISDVLMAAPARFLNASVDEVNFPVRFVNRISSPNVRTLADLLRVKPDELKGKNLGARTLEVAAAELAKFITKKIKTPPLATLREMMTDFANDLLAREARIWEARMGLQGERKTLDAIGNQFGLTRERVRQIESVLFTQFSKRYPAVPTIRENVKDGMTLPDLILRTGELIRMADPLPLVGILELLEPKMYLVRQEGTDPIISTKPQTEFTQAVKSTLSVAEEIFRNSEVPLTKAEMVAALSKAIPDETARTTALATLENEGVWVDGTLLSPNPDRTNVAIGVLQTYPRPVHLEQLSEDVRVLCNEETTAEQLRSALSLVPLVKSFGRGMYGFPRMVPLSDKVIAEIVSYVEGVVSRGASGFQWSVKDLLGKVLDRFDGLNIEHHELNVILQESKKLAYLGRLTWVLRGEHDTERKHYRDIFTSILNKAGKPLTEDVLIERAQKQRGLHLNVHLRNETELLEIAPKVWGLTRRDNPFTKKEVAALTKAFDQTFHNGKEFNEEYLAAKKLNTRGIKPSEIMKVIEVNSEK